MSFRFIKLHQGKIPYTPGGTATVKLPRGNLFTSLNLLAKAKVNVVTNPATNLPDYQVFRLVREIQLLQNQDVKWSLTGEEAAAIFSIINGTTAADNGTIAGAVANAVAGQHYLEFPFAPFDARKAQDYMIDTRGVEWSLKVTWRDATAAGTLFGSIGGTVTVSSNDDIYIKYELEKVDLFRTDPTKPDALEQAAPLLRTIKGDVTNIAATQGDFKIDLSKLKGYRNILLWTTHETNANQEVGVGTILTDKVTLKNTNGVIFDQVDVELLRQQTSQALGVGSSLNAGLYLLPNTFAGSALDALYSDNSNELYLEMAVAKLANTTRIHVIADGQVKQ